MLALYGHPFSSYTWKALIPLYAYQVAFDFRTLDGDQPEHRAVVAAAGPGGKFPVLEDRGDLVFEATSIIEHLAVHHLPDAGLIPTGPVAALRTRMIDRAIDNYVMGPMQAVVAEHLRAPAAPDRQRVDVAREGLRRSYDWLDRWLADNPPGDRITLVECAAAPALFYADWVEPIGPHLTRLAAWRARLLAMPAVSRCVEEARPWRSYFPLGAPQRD